MTGVIYARYSSDSQHEESIEGQLRECYAYAEREGIAIYDTYIDRAFSAKSDKRPAFQQEFKLLRKTADNIFFMVYSQIRTLILIQSISKLGCLFLYPKKLEIK